MRVEIFSLPDIDLDCPHCGRPAVYQCTAYYPESDRSVHEGTCTVCLQDIEKEVDGDPRNRSLMTFDREVAKV